MFASIPWPGIAENCAKSFKLIPVAFRIQQWHVPMDVQKHFQLKWHNPTYLLQILRHQ